MGESRALAFSSAFAAILYELLLTRIFAIVLFADLAHLALGGLYLDRNRVSDRGRESVSTFLEPKFWTAYLRRGCHRQRRTY